MTKTLKVTKKVTQKVTKGKLSNSDSTPTLAELAGRVGSHIKGNKVVIKKTTTKQVAKDKNPNAKVVGLPKPNLGFAKNILWISEDAFTEDLKL